MNSARLTLLIVTLLLTAVGSLAAGGLLRWVGFAALIPLFSLTARLLDFTHRRQRSLVTFREQD